ncbi:MAG: hypothetical protein J1D86_01240 [Alistipes sp.]|nr:hypothetical protein [Alistipes sp.]
MKRILILVLIVFCAIACGSVKKVIPVPSFKTLNLALTAEPHANKYIDLDYGIRVSVKDGRANSRLLQKYDAGTVSTPSVKSNPDVVSFVSESVRRYMRTMGFNLDADVQTDYMLTLTVREFNISYLSGTGWSGTVQLDVVAYDRSGRMVYPNTTAVGRANNSGSSNDFTLAAKTLNQAYANALDDVDWDRIAFFLRKASSPSLEKNKQVTGDGNTALESTVIRWYIDSTPKGADVSTRVVSSTPDVKNTNSNYVGSTPYETTETFDIKGLTFNNSGDVQIEVSCEKAGYITQRRRFNLRQAIEQKEISTKFNLVKDE